MKEPKKIYPSESDLGWISMDGNKTSTEYISVGQLKEWEEKTRAQLFEKFNGHISIGITIAFDELLKFIEE